MTGATAQLRPGPSASRLVVVPSGDAPLVWFEVTARGGSADDPPGCEGLARHGALLARRGAGARDRGALDEELDGLGAALDVSAGRDAVTLSGLCLARNLDRVVDLAADVLAAPRFEPDEHARLLRETPHVIDEIRDDDGSLATRWFDRTCAPGHPYGRTSVGTDASLARLTLEDARDGWRRRTTPRNLVIGIAGDVDDAGAERVARRLVERLPPSVEAPAREPAVPPRPRGRRTLLVDKPDRTQAQLRIGHLGPRYGGPDTPALLLLETAFGGVFSSRLMQEIRVRRGWSYGVGCALRRSALPHWFEISMATAIDVAGEATALTLRMFEDLATRGLADDELAFARDYLVGSMPFHLATARQRMGLAVRDTVFGLPAGYTAELPSRLGELSAADVAAAAARQLHPADAVVVAVATARTTRDALAQTAGAGELEVAAFDAY